MIQININKLKKAYGVNSILKNITFDLHFGEKIAIVGMNGSGKTTLLNIIAGTEEKDSGDLYIAKSVEIGLLNQDAIENLNFEKDYSIIDPKYLSMLNMEINFYSELSSSKLSGGEVTKLALCKLLSLNPNLLLLDEPTNNLDFDGINILISLLNMYDGTLIVISHDRYFLDNLINKTIEIDNGVSKEYFGNYSYYREMKKELFDKAVHRYDADRKEQKEVERAIKQTKQWSEKAHRDSTKRDSSGNTMGMKEYRREKAKRMDKKVKSDIKRLGKMQTSGEKRPLEEKNIYFEIKRAGNTGKRIMEAINISKYYGDKVIFEKSSFTIARGEKIAIFGENGSGKSTFVKIIEKKENLTEGELWQSPSGEPYILHQNFEKLPEEKTVLEYLINLLGKLTASQRNILFSLGITAKHIEQKIKTLSFGEQMKLKLVEPILQDCNFIILDEPTNHIDINTREMLEETLKKYEGTLLIVSHDIELLKNVCNKVLLFEDKKITKLQYSFEEYFNSLQNI